MNHDELTDFEINKKIAKIKYGYTSFWLKHLSNSAGENANKTMVACMTECGESGPQHCFDFCNNPTDAWPIILENRININAYDDEVYWFATTDTSFFVDNKNPLRAAMIVYLKIKGEI